MSDKMREDFNKANIRDHFGKELSFREREIAFDAWCKSREYLIVDLDVDCIFEEGRWYLDEEQVQFALDATGVKYK